MEDDLFTLNGAMKHDPRIALWFSRLEPHRTMVQPWFARMRACGPDVREIFHDGCPVVCVADAPFGYVHAYKAHAGVGFFRGADLPDPARLLEGAGKRMRHVKLRPGRKLDEAALEALIAAAYRDIRKRVRIL